MSGEIFECSSRYAECPPEFQDQAKKLVLRRMKLRAHEAQLKADEKALGLKIMKKLMKDADAAETPAPTADSSSSADSAPVSSDHPAADAIVSQ